MPCLGIVCKQRVGCCHGAPRGMAGSVIRFAARTITRVRLPTPGICAIELHFPFTVDFPKKISKPVASMNDEASELSKIQTDLENEEREPEVRYLWKRPLLQSVRKSGFFPPQFMTF